MNPRRALTLLALLAAIVVGAQGARATERPVPIERKLRDLSPGQQELEARNARLLAKLRWRERQVRRLHRQVRRLRREAQARFRPSVLHAIALASAIWGVPRGELVAVGSCESGLDPFATNGQYRGVFQEGPMFERGPFRAFGVFDPYANVFTAALTVAREGWRQWECRP